MDTEKKVLKNISYTLLSNIIAFLSSALVTFVVPKQLGVESYGYFQLYLFFTSYLGFLHFGWADGLFLRYGGSYYDQLNKPLFCGQFRIYIMFEAVLGLVLCAVGGLFIANQDKSMVAIALGMVVIIHLPRTFLQYILQGTNRIKEYATLVVLERIACVMLVVVAMLARVTSYVPVIVADMIGKLCALAYAVWQCRDILHEKPAPLRVVMDEIKQNVMVGSKLMFANIASFLIIGIVRISIENQWDVTTFGKVSLTMSVSNLLMLLIKAVALVMFPMLRRTASDKLADIYETIRTSLMIPLLGMLMFYYPIKEILSYWLPVYAEMLKYMALLFPMCIFESKMSMLIETYMKTLRKEREILYVNLVTVVLSAVLTWITVYVLHSLDLAVVTIVAVLAFRCVVAEMILAAHMRIKVCTDIVMEIFMTVAFIIFSWFVGGVAGLVLYVVVYICYLIIKRRDILKIFCFVMKLR